MSDWRPKDWDKHMDSAVDNFMAHSMGVEPRIRDAMELGAALMLRRLNIMPVKEWPYYFKEK